MNSEFVSIIAEELSIPRKSVNATVKLLEDGATIPFISRYRKEATGALDENAIHNIERRYCSLEALEKRKEAILASMEKQENLLTIYADASRTPVRPLLSRIYTCLSVPNAARGL